ncbi:hypothetical protein MKW94_012492 [Papaver nudicaule]|uniref:Alpha/beta hydrolase fold-3 domain-containing protein n=1 Tax=Papaver nudicaule TaxID=74823 RepID=A0AA41VL53_PAPNU|nr:hypothetical protein [Papaver nudicaule]
MRAAENHITNVIRGICLVHPFFWGSEPFGSEIDMDFRALTEKMWSFMYPSAKRVDDPMCNPFVPGAPSISILGCKRVLVCVAGKDPLKHRGGFYVKELKRSGWKGEEIELFESEEDEHEFHLYNPDGESAQLLFKCIASFLNK